MLAGMTFYRLNDQNQPEPCDSPEEAMAALGGEPTQSLKVTDFGGQRISSIFLSFPHTTLGNAEPVFFEVMVFGGPFDGLCLRYATYREVIITHDQLEALLVALGQRRGQSWRRIKQFLRRDFPPISADALTFFGVLASRINLRRYFSNTGRRQQAHDFQRMTPIAQQGAAVH